jgi:hypothetical protein
VSTVPLTTASSELTDSSPTTAEVAFPGTGERRSAGRDRRARLWGSLLHGGFNPRRRTGRRATDRYRPIVDWHDPWLFASSTLILLLCVADGLLTLRLLDGGAVEANPFMALYVYDHARRFAIVKLALTGAGVLTLVSLARFRVFRLMRASALVHLILLAYLVLVGYELMLLERIS